MPWTSQEVDDDSCTSITGGTVRFTAPATGWYFFYFSIYTAESDSSNSFTFAIDGTLTDFAPSTDFGTGHVAGHSADDWVIAYSKVLKLTSSQYVTVISTGGADAYAGHSHWGGCRIG